jgi:hypothetical protein
MKKSPLILIFVSIITINLMAATPEWVKTYGVTTPYPRITHLTGYAMVNKDEDSSREILIEKSLADLSKKIKIKIQSDLVINEMESKGEYESSLSSVTRSSINTTVSSADFIFHEDRNSLHCLAYISIDSLLNFYSDEASLFWTTIQNALSEAAEFTKQGKSDKALEILYASNTAFPELYERWSLYKSVNSPSSDQNFFNKLPNANSISQIKDSENDYESLLDDISSREAGSLTEGLNKIATIMAMQNVPGSQIQVPPLLFGSTSFSSEFGRYAGDRLESVLVDQLNSERTQVIFKGQYWQEEEKIRLLVIAVNLDGEKLGKAEVIIPLSATGNRELKPQNFDQAMIALQEFADGALTEGGINIDIWTNKGNDEEALAFTNGETLQLYFRVNQPAFLQITYKLATGEMVLLEKSFYIGSDRVNRTVPLPYEFEVQAPFGIEQMIVTAYSVEPPTASTVPKLIDGELYDVFNSVGDVVVNTRGLGRKKTANTEMRVGEAMLNMTMMAE